MLLAHLLKVRLMVRLIAAFVTFSATFAAASAHAAEPETAPADGSTAGGSASVSVGATTPGTGSAAAGASVAAPAAEEPAEPVDLEAEYEKLDPETKAQIEARARKEAETRIADHFNGFQNALRLGIDIPFGDVPQRGGGFPYEAASLSSYVKLRVPIWVDAGYRLGPNWWAGSYVQVGLGPAGDDCPGEVDCFWTDFRIGVSGKYHFAPFSDWDPWVGLGLGYEWLEAVVSVVVPVTAGDPPVTTDQTFRFRRNLNGPQGVLDFGADYRVADWFTVGPFAALSLSVFVDDSIQCPAGVPVSCPSGSSVDNGAFHGGVSLGARGRFGP